MNSNDSTTIAATHQQPTVWASLREELRAKRAARAAHKKLVQELSAYSTQSDRDDLEALLNRYDDADTAEIRSILQQRSYQAA
jgi:hypothetical protein